MKVPITTMFCKVLLPCNQKCSIRIAVAAMAPAAYHIAKMISVGVISIIIVCPFSIARLNWLGMFFDSMSKHFDICEYSVSVS